MTKESKTKPESKQRNSASTAKEIVDVAVEALHSKKAMDVVVMSMSEVSGIADYFVVATGQTDIQIKALVEAVKKGVREECNESPWHVEGQANRHWVLMDYVDVVVHLFDPERRAYYDIERLWADAPTEQMVDVAPEK